MTIESELAALHPPLLRFAKLQLRNDSAAEDVVSETLLAILEKPDSFEGRSSLRTYATGILKLVWRAAMKLQLDCKDASRLISDAQDMTLPAAERTRLRLHFVICATCRNVNEQIEFLRRAMRRLGESQKADGPQDL